MTDNGLADCFQKFRFVFFSLKGPPDKRHDFVLLPYNVISVVSVS